MGYKKSAHLYDLYKNGNLVERIEDHSEVGITDGNQVHQILARTGFDVASEFGDYDFSEYKHGHQQLIIEAVKRERQFWLSIENRIVGKEDTCD